MYVTYLDEKKNAKRVVPSLSKKKGCHKNSTGKGESFIELRDLNSKCLIYNKTQNLKTAQERVNPLLN